MSYFDYEKTLFGYFENFKAQMLSRPLNLGGVAGSGGGGGGPTGGFLGTLPQTRVAYDMSELAINTLPISGLSLLDNLNKIRYRINLLEAGSGTVGGPGSITIYESGTLLASGITQVNFANADVTLDSSSKITVTIPEATKILLLHANGGGTSSFTADASGLTQALAAASTTNDVVLMPAISVTGNFTVPTNVILRGTGMWITTITGKVTLMQGSQIEDLSISNTANSGSPVIAIEVDAAANYVEVNRCYFFATNTGVPELSYSLYVTEGTAVLTGCTLGVAYFDSYAEGEFHESNVNSIYCTYPNVKLYNCISTRSELSGQVLYYFDASFDMREPWDHASDIYEEVWLHHLPYPGTAGNIVQDNGTSWESVALESAGFAPVDHTHTSDDITSVGTTSGYVLTANGAGGASWQQSTGSGVAASDHGDLTGLTDLDHPASAIYTNTSNFSGLLSGSDTTVQAALETLDNVVIASGGGHAIYSGATAFPQRSKLTFSGNVTVIDDVANDSTTITVLLQDSITNLDDLADVNTTSPQEGDALVYSGGI